MIAKSVPMEQGLLSPNHPLWDIDGYSENARRGDISTQNPAIAAVWSNGKGREDLRRASESYWNEWYSTFEVT